MTEPFLLRCVDTGASLTLRRVDEHEWHALLEAGNLRAETPVYVEGHFHESSSFARLFQEMARDWRGWDDVRKWATLEGEVELGFSIDRLGHVTVRIRMLLDAVRAWRVEATVMLESGYLDELARQAATFAGS